MKLSQNQKQLVTRLGIDGVRLADLTARELREIEPLIEAGAAFLWWKGLIAARYAATEQGLKAAQAPE